MDCIIKFGWSFHSKLIFLPKNSLLNPPFLTSENGAFFLFNLSWRRQKKNLITSICVCVAGRDSIPGWTSVYLLTLIVIFGKCLMNFLVFHSQSVLDFFSSYFILASGKSEKNHSKRDTHARPRRKLDGPISLVGTRWKEVRFFFGMRLACSNYAEFNCDAKLNSPVQKWKLEKRNIDSNSNGDFFCCEFIIINLRGQPRR